MKKSEIEILFFFHGLSKYLLNLEFQESDVSPDKTEVKKGKL